jgi:hypothetical protein
LLTLLLALLLDIITWWNTCVSSFLRNNRSWDTLTACCHPKQY